MKKTFKEKDLLIRKYASEYNKSKIIELKGLELINKDIVCDNAATYIDTKNKYTYYYSLQAKIDFILEKLDWEESNFIKKEFFSNNYRNGWWMNYYSKSTYYRLKNKAMGKFLGFMYD